MKNKKHLKFILLVLLIILMVLSIGTFYREQKEIISYDRKHLSLKPSEEISLHEAKKEPFYSWSKEEWKANHDINNDYVANLRFESNIIDLPVVQGETNESYLRTDWKTMNYDEMGSIFIDYEIIYKDGEYQEEDNNIVMYGHYCYPYIDPSQTKMFTPLKVLIDEKNYEDNKYIQLLFEDEVRRYIVADVFYCELISYDGSSYLYTRDDMEYYRGNFTKEYLDVFKERISERRFYDTGIDYDENDKLLTMQTCVENHNELRLIVIAKEIDRVLIP